MATNLILGNCTIPLAASTFTCTHTASTTYPLKNLLGGTKVDRFELATATTGDVTFTADLGALTTKTANFLYLGKAAYLRNNYVATITLKRHTANSYAAGTAVATLSSFTTATMQAPGEDDYLTTFTETAAFRYWFLNLNAGTSSKYPFAKAFFGKSFDMGRDPDEDGGITISRVQRNYSNIRAAYTIELTWTGVTYAKTVEFYETFVLPRRYNPVILYTTSYHPALDDQRILFGRITTASMPPKVTGYNTVSMTFEENV